MWINAIFWRSVLDFIYLVHFVVKFYNEVESLLQKKKKKKRMKLSQTLKEKMSQKVKGTSFETAAKKRKICGSCGCGSCSTL